MTIKSYEEAEKIHHILEDKACTVELLCILMCKFALGFSIEKKSNHLAFCVRHKCIRNVQQHLLKYIMEKKAKINFPLLFLFEGHH